MRINLINITCLIALFLTTASCSKDDTEIEMNVAELTESLNYLSMITFLTAYVDLYGSQEETKNLGFFLNLKTEGDRLTFFAPTDEAFNSLDQTGDATFTRSDISALENRLGSTRAVADMFYLIILNHVSANYLLSDDLIGGQRIVTQAESQTMDDANYGLSFKMSPEMSFVSSYARSVAIVESADNVTSNGVVYIINKVLLDDLSAAVLGLPEDK